MSLTPGEAADSLKEIQRTQSRSASARGYANTSPFLILWGVIWMIGYGGQRPGAALLPTAPGLLLTLAGFAGAPCGIGRARAPAQGNPHPGMNAHAGLRFVAMFVAIGLFVAATYAIFGSATTAQQAAFIPLVVALAYIMLGIWKGAAPCVVTGVAVAALTLGGFFLLQQHFLLWMAVVGGGALVLAGLWLRKV